MVICYFEIQREGALHRCYIQQHNMKCTENTYVNNNKYKGKYTAVSNSCAAFQPQMNKTFKLTLQSSLPTYNSCGQLPTSDYKLCLLTPYSIVLLEKLTGSQLVKKAHAFYGTGRFITTFISSGHLSLT